MTKGETPRAGAPAREGWRVTAIRLPDKECRTPRAVVMVERDGMALGVTARRLRKGGGRLQVAMPVAADGSPGVLLPPADHAALVGAVAEAVRRDPAAWQHLGPRW